jgi:hypothetical protein
MAEVYARQGTVQISHFDYRLTAFHSKRTFGRSLRDR